MTEEDPAWLTRHQEGDGARLLRAMKSRRKFARDAEVVGYMFSAVAVALAGVTIGSAAKVSWLEFMPPELSGISALGFTVAALVFIFGGRAGRHHYNDL